MRRDLKALQSDTFDLLVVGGGIHGVAAAYDASLRGLSVALVERGDFGSEASGNHLKTVHGGLRYLQTADLARMRESIVERRTVARIAPYLVTPLPYLVPTYRKLTRSALAMRVAFMVDACIGFDRNRGVPSHLRLPAGHLVDRDEYQRRFRWSRQDEATGGATWCDYQMRHADRLTLAFAIGASRAGAVLANYVTAEMPVLADRRVTGMRVRDMLAGGEFEVRARVTLNVAGAGAPRLLATLGDRRPLIMLKSLNVVTTRQMDGPALGGSLPDGRMLFLVPWRGRMMTGTSQSLAPVSPDAAGVSEEELGVFLSDINTAFPALGLEADEISLVHRGIVPGEWRRNGTLTLRKHFQIRDHHRDGLDGALSLIGVKYTTGRGVAEVAVDAVVRKLGRSAGPCRTSELPLPGAEEDPSAALRSLETTAPPALGEACALGGLVEVYGSMARDIVAIAAREPALARPLCDGASAIGAQVAHAVREEMACRLADVVLRRLPIGAAGYPGRAVVDAAGRIAGAELGWDVQRARDEVAAVEAAYAPAPLSPRGFSVR